mmetsp:Transcript_5893/g.17199  ORF Transcript_5893/g.17199 Transcript_5893/m.17199 type:complete len:214 (+) Transcript_5893:332-973(+)
MAACLWWTSTETRRCTSGTRMAAAMRCLPPSIRSWRSSGMTSSPTHSSSWRMLVSSRAFPEARPGGNEATKAHSKPFRNSATRKSSTRRHGGRGPLQSLPQKTGDAPPHHHARTPTTPHTGCLKMEILERSPISRTSNQESPTLECHRLIDFQSHRAQSRARTARPWCTAHRHTNTQRHNIHIPPARSPFPRALSALSPAPAQEPPPSPPRPG